jgi:hypothetical protein
VVSFTPRPLYPEGKSPWYWIGGWVGSRVGLDAVVKRKIPNPCPDHLARSSWLNVLRTLLEKLIVAQLVTNFPVQPFMKF